MAVSTIKIPFQEDFLQQIDIVVMRESCSRVDLILEATKIHIDRKRNWQELFSYGSDIASKGNFSEIDVMKEIKAHRKK